METLKASLPNISKASQRRQYDMPWHHQWCCITGQSRMRSWVTGDLACEVSDQTALISQVESMKPAGNITPATDAAVISTSESNYSSVNGTTLLTWRTNPTKDDKTHQSCAVTCLRDTAALLSVALTSQEVLTDKLLVHRLPWQARFYLLIIYETLFSSTFTLSLHPFALLGHEEPFLTSVFQKLQQGYFFRRLALVL